MNIFLIIVIVLLVIAVVFLLIVKNAMQKKLEYYKMISSNISTVSVIQKMFDILGSNMLSSKKIEEMNKVILETYKPRYSTISVFDGNGYEAMATNVDKEYLDCIVNVADDNDFKVNASKNVSKYLTTTSEKTLSYQSATERRIKSAMFSPIYFNKTYLGFWIMEDELTNAFDTISKDELAKIKSNLGVFLDTIQFQNTMEIAELKDRQTGFYNNLYLYSNVRNTLVNYDTSVIVSVCVENIPDVNDEFGRNAGNELLLLVANTIKEFFSDSQILVRYSGIKFLIIIPNTDIESTQQAIERMIARLKSVSIKVNGNDIFPTNKLVMHLFRKQNNIEKEIQKIMRATDGMKDVNTMKIM